MHDDLIRAGRRRIVGYAVGGLVLLAVSVALVLLPFVWLGVVVVELLRSGDVGWGPLLRSGALCLAVGAIAGGSLFLLSLLRSERRVTETVGVRPGRVPDDAAARVRNLVEGLALAAGIPAPDVAVVADPAPNCLTVGRRPGSAWIVVTSGMLDRLGRDELEAVLAYEVGRVAVWSVSLDTVVYASTAVAFQIWVGAFDELDEMSLVLVPLAVLATPLVVVGMLLRRGALRSRARLSDGLAVAFCRNPAALLRALRAVDADSRTVRVADLTTAHLWLSYPHTRSSRLLLGSGGLLRDRIARLERALPPGP